MFPVIVAASLSVISLISSAQLSSLDRQGTVIAFQVVSVALTVLLGSTGWHLWGIKGFAWGIAASRISGIAQDICLMRIVGRLGLLSRSAARTTAVQALIAAPFFLISSCVDDWHWAVAAAMMHGLCAAIPVLQPWTAGGPRQIE
jgi:hypothetical protein